MSMLHGRPKAGEPSRRVARSAWEPMMSMLHGRPKAGEPSPAGGRRIAPRGQS